MWKKNSTVIASLPGSRSTRHRRANSGKPPDASRTIAVDDRRVDSLASAARARGRSGGIAADAQSIAEALEAARGIEDETDRVLVIFLCGIQVGIDDAAGAARSMSEARSLAETIEDDESRVFAFAHIARNRPRLGDLSRAPHTIAGALPVARRIADDNARASARCDIAETQVWTGDGPARFARSRRGRTLRTGRWVIANPVGFAS